MKLSHWERNQNTTNRIFWILRNLEKFERNFFKWSINCNHYKGLEEIGNWLRNQAENYQNSINAINQFIDLVNSEDGYKTPANFMDDLFDQVFREAKKSITKLMKDRSKLVDAVNVIASNKKVEKEILNTFKFKPRRGKLNPIKKAKHVYELISLTPENLKMLDIPNYE